MGDNYWYDVERNWVVALKSPEGWRGEGVEGLYARSHDLQMLPE